ncbi:MAG: hypothetical protein ACI37Z_10400 [Candidatus Gastranaerophilaceae bacterium]
MAIIVIFSILFALKTGFDYGPKLQYLNNEYKQEYSLNTELIQEQDKFRNITEEEKKILAEMKARTEGYSYIGDIVYYDVN